jgi:hypothetical protein
MIRLETLFPGHRRHYLAVKSAMIAAAAVLVLKLLGGF